MKNEIKITKKCLCALFVAVAFASAAFPQTKQSSNVKREPTPDWMRLENVPKDYIGTYIPLSYEKIMAETGNFFTALYKDPEDPYPILMLTADSCYSDLHFHDGYALEKEIFADFKYEEDSKKNKILVDEKGRKYKKIADTSRFDGGYSAYKGYVLSVIFQNAPKLQGVRVDGENVLIRQTWFEPILDAMFFGIDEHVSLLLLADNGRVYALEIWGIDGRLTKVVPTSEGMPSSVVSNTVFAQLRGLFNYVKNPVVEESEAKVADKTTKKDNGKIVFSDENKYSVMTERIHHCEVTIGDTLIDTDYNIYKDHAYTRCIGSFKGAKKITVSRIYTVTSKESNYSDTWFKIKYGDVEGWVLITGNYVMENGVVGYHGQLDIRPKYQREFIYKDDQQKAVIDTIKKGYPLNIMYWVETEKDKYELLDGQQRTMSICQFYKGSVWYTWDNDLVTFNNLKQDQKDRFLDYELTVYICKNGTDSERLEWFRTINIAGEKLEEQEIRNAVYAGEWVTDLKKKFAKSNSVGVLMGSDYLNGEPIRQKYVETVLKWISAKDVTDPNLRKDTDKRIKAYMALHQHDKNADYEWQYFQNVINWVKTLFPTYRKKIMKGLDWGTWYNLYGQTTSNNPDFTATKLEERIQELINADEITNQKGIYEYLLTGNENMLSLREKENTKYDICNSLYYNDLQNQEISL